MSTIVRAAPGVGAGSATTTSPQTIAYAAVITPDAAAGSLFRCVALGSLTLSDPINGTDGKTVTVQVQASTATCTLSFTGDAPSVNIPTGRWWSGTLRYVAAASEWILDGAVGVDMVAATELPGPAPARYFFPLSAAAAGTTASHGAGVLRVVPWHLTSAVQVDSLGAEITAAGDAGSRLRLGLYADTGAGYPGQLIVDAGGAPADTVGTKNLAVPPTTLKAGLYWLAACVQAVTTTQPTIRTVSGYNPPIAIGSPAEIVAGQVIVGHSTPSVTAALPTSFPAGTFGSGTMARMHLATVVPGGRTIPTNGPVETRAGNPFFANTPNQPYSLIRMPGGVDRFELRPGDKYAPDSAGVERCEFNGGQKNWPFDTDVWLSLAFRVTAASLQAAPGWMVVCQLNGVPDSGEIDRSPPFAIELEANRLRIATRSDPAATSTSVPAPVYVYQQNPFNRAVWNRFVWRIRFARTGNGELQGWHNGTEVYPTASIPIGYNDTIGPLAKYGAYRAAGFDQNVVVEHVNFEVSTGSLLSRVTDPLPLPS